MIGVRTEAGSCLSEKEDHSGGDVPACCGSIAQKRSRGCQYPIRAELNAWRMSSWMNREVCRVLTLSSEGPC